MAFILMWIKSKAMYKAILFSRTAAILLVILGLLSIYGLVLRFIFVFLVDHNLSVRSQSLQVEPMDHGGYGAGSTDQYGECFSL